MGALNGNSMLRCLVFGAALFWSSAAIAEIRVCNRSSLPEIDVAFGFYDDAKGWTSVGWAVIGKNLCIHPSNLFVSSGGNPFSISNSTSYYLYGTKDDREWSAGNGQLGAFFCLDPTKRFTLYTSDHIRAADNVLDCAAHGLVAKSFRQSNGDDEQSYTFDDSSAVKLAGQTATPQQMPNPPHQWTVSPRGTSHLGTPEGTTFTNPGGAPCPPQWDAQAGAWVCKH